MTGMRHCRVPDGSWLYPNSKEVLEEVGLFSIAHYVGVRKQTVKGDNLLWSRAIRDLVEVKQRLGNDQVAAPHMSHLLQCLETKWLKAEVFLLRYILALAPCPHQQTTS